MDNKNIKILTIDDEYGFLDSVEEHFEYEGTKVLKAENGETGIEIFQKEKPDVVLIDLVMPGMSGLDVLKTIVKESPETPAIIVSGHGSIHDVIHAMNFGAWDYVVKPIRDLLEIEVIINRVLEKARLISENRQYRIYLEEKTKELKESNRILRLEVKERKQYEEELKEYHSRLEDIVENRTNSLQKASELLAKEISDHEKAEEKLKLTDEKYRSILENIEEIYFETDLAGNIVFLSGDDNLNLGGKALKGPNTKGIMDGDNEKIIRQAFDTVLKTGKILKAVEFDAILENDIKRQFEISVLPVKGLDNKTIGLRGIAKDITDRKRTERKLELYRYRLEQIVDERTNALRTAKIIAENANIAKSEFLANISHELRTPMHGILSYSRFGIDKANTVEREKLSKYFVNINNSAQRLMLLLNDLLDLSKFEYGNHSFNMYHCNVFKIVNDRAFEFDSILKEKQLFLQIEEPDFDTTVICDEQKVGQIIKNLLSNAAKYSDKDKSIRISFHEDTLDLDQEAVRALKISIADQGVGVPVEELKTIFDKFIQSSNTKTGAGGTGLGLAICFEIVKAHHGKIWAENNPDGGTVFNVLLPFKHDFLMKNKQKI